MKIKVTTYNIRRYSSRDSRLKIGLTFDDGVGKTFFSNALIQMHPIAYFWGKVPDITFSLLYLAAIIYGIDRSVNRHTYSVDGWSRELDVDLKIPDYDKFLPLEGRINAMLSFLTGDYWNCHFVGPASVKYGRYKVTDYYDGITQVNLFSGGLDSLIGAIDYMTDNPEGKLFLASHYDSGMPGPLSDQNGLKQSFNHKFKGEYCTMPAVMIRPTLSNELSCRSRSLMFLSIALIVASYSKCNIVVPENGSVSLNYPLSPSRRASCSTRTTHPVFMKMFRDILSELDIDVEVVNPYEKMTKGEMVSCCSDKEYLLSVVNMSNSCGKRGMHQHMYDNHTATHCGHCMPCMYRRASMIGEHDTTTYGNSFGTLYQKKGSKVAEDFFAMLNSLKKVLSKDDIRRELRIAGLSSFEDLDDYVKLVERTRKELKAMIMADSNPAILKYMGW